MRRRIKIRDLTPHKKNQTFFDDIDGDAWSEFLESVRTSGVIEPIVVTTENVIVSGHQRVRACKALHIDEIDAEVREYESEDEVLKQLIETNIRQRGVGNTNPVKFGRCLIELERIYGVRDGSAGKVATSLEPNKSGPKSEKELAAQLGISTDTIQNYKKLATAIPELQSLVESGKVTKTVALGIIKRLSDDEQKQLVDMLPSDGERISNHQVKFYESRIEALNNDKNDLQKQITDLEQRGRNLEDQIAELEEARSEVQVREIKVEVIPDDYDALKKAKEESDVKIVELTKEIIDQKAARGNQVDYKAMLFADLTALNKKYGEFVDVGGAIRQWVKRL